VCPHASCIVFAVHLPNVTSTACKSNINPLCIMPHDVSVCLAIKMSQPTTDTHACGRSWMGSCGMLHCSCWAVGCIHVGMAGFVCQLLSCRDRMQYNTLGNNVIIPAHLCHLVGVGSELVCRERCRCHPVRRPTTWQANHHTDILRQ
jgi:hypothetical protein